MVRLADSERETVLVRLVLCCIYCAFEWGGME